MREDVSTTPRKALTATQLRTLWEQSKGICCLCGLPIDKRKKWLDTLKGEKGFRDEHIRPLGLGGSNDMSNRGAAHAVCALEKDIRDRSAISKAKRQKNRDLGIRTRKGPPIRSRGFSTMAKEPTTRTPSKLAGLERRGLYTEQTTADAPAPVKKAKAPKSKRGQK